LVNESVLWRDRSRTCNPEGILSHILATILQHVSARLKKTDLLGVAQCLIGHLPYNQVPALAKRHQVDVKNDSESAQELLTKQVSKYDESELCKLLLKSNLLDSAYQRPAAAGDDVLINATQRCRADAGKLQKAVVKEFAAKQDKKQSSRRFARRQTAARALLTHILGMLSPVGVFSPALDTTLIVYP
jgi:hypothetical protein